MLNRKCRRGDMLRFKNSSMTKRYGKYDDYDTNPTYMPEEGPWTFI